MPLQYEVLTGSVRNEVGVERLLKSMHDRSIRNFTGTGALSCVHNSHRLMTGGDCSHDHKVSRCGRIDVNSKLCKLWTVLLQKNGVAQSGVNFKEDRLGKSIGIFLGVLSRAKEM